MYNNVQHITFLKTKWAHRCLSPRVSRHEEVFYQPALMLQGEQYLQGLHMPLIRHVVGHVLGQPVTLVGKLCELLVILHQVSQVLQDLGAIAIGRLVGDSRV